MLEKPRTRITGGQPLLEATYEKIGSTAGLHINISAGNKNDLKNLFVAPDNDLRNIYSRLARNCARNLLALQKDGLVIYAPKPESYKRLNTKQSFLPAPREFSIDTAKSGATILLRDDVKEHHYEEYSRIEDRLAGCDANPYLVMLANVGAIYKTVIDEKSKAPQHSKPIPIDSKMFARKRAREKFERSQLWRKIAGEELYKDLVAYFKAPGRDETIGH